MNYRPNPQTGWGYGISIEELLAKKEKTQNLYITSCAVVLQNFTLFLGNTHDECFSRASRAGEGEPDMRDPTGNSRTFHNFQMGYLATDGKFYDPIEAGMIAYRNRQTPTLCSPLKPEDIF